MGAAAKVKDLEDSYPTYFENSKAKRDLTSAYSSTVSTTESSSSSSSQAMDLNSVMKASQIISGEIHLEKLLEKMMKVVIENAGAERGIFLLKNTNPSSDTWLIQAARLTKI